MKAKSLTAYRKIMMAASKGLTKEELNKLLKSYHKTKREPITDRTGLRVIATRLVDIRSPSHEICVFTYADDTREHKAGKYVMCRFFSANQYTQICSRISRGETLVDVLNSCE